MYRFILFLTFSLSTLFSFAQINFEKGYFIDNNGNKIECFIKNKEWQKNPTEFEYKTSLTDQSSIATIEVVKEFSVYNYSKYLRYTVQIDSSSNMPSEYSKIESPIWGTRTLFLKVLLEGKASLYLYDDLFNKKFFFKTDSSSLEQLIFKKYSEDGVRVKANRFYKQQLWNNLRNENYTIKQMEALSYEQKDIEEYFLKYNNSTNSSKYINHQKNKWLLKPLLGVGFSKCALYDLGIVNKQYDGTQKSNYLFGVQLEYILPVNKNKWSIITEYSNQSSEHEANNGTDNATAIYKSSNLSIGGRYYTFINDNVSFFISGLYTFKFSKGSYLTLQNTNTGMSFNNPFSFGVGINLYKFNIEYRLTDAKEILYKGTNWRFEKANQSFLILSYNLFDIGKK